MATKKSSRNKLPQEVKTVSSTNGKTTLTAKLPSKAPRNPLVAVVMTKKSGAHEKTASAIRNEAKRALSKTLKGESDS